MNGKPVQLPQPEQKDIDFFNIQDIDQKIREIQNQMVFLNGQVSVLIAHKNFMENQQEFKDKDMAEFFNDSNKTNTDND